MPPQCSLNVLSRHRIAGLNNAHRNRYGPVNSRNNHPTTKLNLLKGKGPFCEFSIINKISILLQKKKTYLYHREHNPIGEEPHENMN